MSTARHRPSRPIEAFPVAELPPLPPAGAPGEVAERPAEPLPTAKTPVEIATLDFLEPASRSTVVALEHPFRLDGAEVREITVRRLAAGEVGLIVGDLGPDDPVELYAFFSKMTGLPAPVLRGLDDADNDRVVAAARPFLPLYAQALFYGLISGSGDATSSSPLAP